MVQVVIRDFRAEDVGVMVELHNQVGEWFEETGVPLSRDFIISIAGRPDFRFYVAEVESRGVVGFAGVLYYESVGRADLGPVCVSPEFQNSGVGSKLVARVLDFLRERRIHRVVVHVKSENHAGLEFFTGLGFQFEAHLRNYTRKGEDVVQMVFFP